MDDFVTFEDGGLGGSVGAGCIVLGVHALCIVVTCIHVTTNSVPFKLHVVITVN